MRILALLLITWTAVAAQASETPKPAIPASGTLNKIVIEVLRAYPTDGTHAYHWPKEGSWKGCTKDLMYRGQVLAKGDPKKRAYCCGLTFEVFLQSWLQWCERSGHESSVAGLGLEGLRQLQSQWFGSKEDPTCHQTAMLKNGIGHVVENWEEALPGDFVQLWRNNKSGHSVIFLEWVREGKEIVGLKYWSTQPSTKGIGERVERFGAGKQDMDRSKFYLCRLGVPSVAR
ncbi:MAG TPA: hypothetical protein PKA37_14185 [Planctomycetota bacterium]|nr:hypothetical protein [Planctomycetota bacterium]